MEFFHISRRERWYIALFLNAAIICQLVHQVTAVSAATATTAATAATAATAVAAIGEHHYHLRAPAHQVLHSVWDDVIVYFSSPQGQISLATGPIAGIVTGVGAGIIQFRAEDRLHLKAPDRFPPGLLATAREAVRRVRSGEGLASLLADIRSENKSERLSAAQHKTGWKGVRPAKATAPAVAYVGGTPAAAGTIRV